MPSLYIETYGCQMNLADTELIIGTLEAHGWTRVHEAREADLILLNTCAIREHAEERVLGRLGALARHKDRPGVRLGVTGCMAQHLRSAIHERAPWVDLLVGPDGYRHLPDLLADGEHDPHVGLRLDPEETYADLPIARGEGIRAWITIMRGCDRFCTFCVVPYVRGRERSLPGPVVVEQVRTAVAAGAREVVLLGQTVNAYRHDDWDFARLLREIATAVPDLLRLRFTSPHPAEMTEAAVEAMATCPVVAPQLHLPVQSGSDRVLERMARDYSIAEYEDLVACLRERIPGIALSTDVIVGFPGERDEDFAATLGLLERIRYDAAFLFKYSPRSGTRAYKWDDDVPEPAKAARLATVIATQERIGAEINRQLVGAVAEVLVEGPARRTQGWLAGKTPQMKTAILPGPADVGELVPVRIEAATAHSLRGVRAAPASSDADRGAPARSA